MKYFGKRSKIKLNLKSGIASYVPALYQISLLYFEGPKVREIPQSRRIIYLSMSKEE